MKLLRQWVVTSHHGITERRSIASSTQPRGQSIANINYPSNSDLNGSYQFFFLTQMTFIYLKILNNGQASGNDVTLKFREASDSDTIISICRTDRDARLCTGGGVTLFHITCWRSEL